ncbi:hypothetical protein GCM10022224_065420 [Nonomuraea antimicrobica]|uniref:Uncharacterized protein n=1 Tax=Nonomuraea antimicrobica TaxID=561173 RepID=A0ABP7CHS7_9ACTN
MSVGRRVVVSRRPAALGHGPASVRPASVRSFDGSAATDVPAIVGLQLRQGLRTVAAVGGLLVGAPVLAAWVPDPWAWVALSVAMQAAWVALAVRQLRRAERLER